jgi:hypothetical protein
VHAPAVRVQSHPSRASLLPHLLDALSGFENVAVVTDPAPEQKADTWRAFRACLLSMPKEAGWLITLQDDALPRPDFAERMLDAIEARPESVLLPFVPGFRYLRKAMLEAQRQHARYALFRVGAFVPLVAICMPREVVTGLLEWADNGRGDRMRRPLKGADDGIVAHFCRLRRIHPLMMVPSICDHDDTVPSVNKSVRQGPHRRAALL